MGEINIIVKNNKINMNKKNSTDKNLKTLLYYKRKKGFYLNKYVSKCKNDCWKNIERKIYLKEVGSCLKLFEKKIKEKRILEKIRKKSQIRDQSIIKNKKVKSKKKVNLET